MESENLDLELLLENIAVELDQVIEFDSDEEKKFFLESVLSIVVTSEPEYLEENLNQFLVENYQEPELLQEGILDTLGRIGRGIGGAIKGTLKHTGKFIKRVGQGIGAAMPKFGSHYGDVNVYKGRKGQDGKDGRDRDGRGGSGGGGSGGGGGGGGSGDREDFAIQMARAIRGTGPFSVQNQSQEATGGSSNIKDVSIEGPKQTVQQGVSGGSGTSAPAPSGTAHSATSSATANAKADAKADAKSAATEVAAAKAARAKNKTWEEGGRGREAYKQKFGDNWEKEYNKTSRSARRARAGARSTATGTANASASSAGTPASGSSPANRSNAGNAGGVAMRTGNTQLNVASNQFYGDTRTVLRAHNEINVEGSHSVQEMYSAFLSKKTPY